MKNIRVVKPYVYVVLEHDTFCVNKSLQKSNPNGKSAVLHGIYLNREEAEGKIKALLKRPYKHILERDEEGNIENAQPVWTEGYLSVLKKPLYGADILDKKGIKIKEK